MSGWKAVSSYLFYTDKIYSLPSFLPGKVWHIISFTLARPVVFFSRRFTLARCIIFSSSPRQDVISSPSSWQTVVPPLSTWQSLSFEYKPLQLEKFCHRIFMNLSCQPLVSITETVVCRHPVNLPLASH